MTFLEQALIYRFRIEKILNQGPVTWSQNLVEIRLTFFGIDQGGRRITLLGFVDGSKALLTAERAAFPSDEKTMRAFHGAIQDISNLGANDVYHWYLASSGSDAEAPPDLKLNLIYPCTDQHIRKYSPQPVRMVTETPRIYQQHVRAFMQNKRNEGRLNWVFNILEGRTEQEDVILRDPGHREQSDDGFIMLPDLNWDRKTLTSLHLLGLVERRDIWSLRDLKKKHVEWLKHMREKLLDAVVGLYKHLEKDMLKLYIHCKLSWEDHVFLSNYAAFRSAHVLPFPRPHRACHA